MTRDGTALKLNGAAFRFAGGNIYWLGLDENVGGVDYPTQFRVDDALDTVAEMGGNVVRTFAALSVGSAKSIQPTLGSFNETALTYLDYVVKACKDRGIRLILPLVDSANPTAPYYIGGTKTYTDWRSLANSDAFYTDATVLADFKLHISIVMNRVNTLTGVAYKNEPTILAWETGNEMHTIGNAFPATAWTQAVASYIKSIAPRHLVIDGEYTGASVNGLALTLRDIDIYSNHYYPMNVTNLNANIASVTAAVKAFYVGEYGWESTSPDSLATFLAAVESGSVVGDSYWSGFPHLDTYGYVVHADGHTLYYPGLDASPGQSGMRAKAQTLRTHAYTIRGISVPADGVPKTPLITSVTGSAGAAAVAWRGAAIADTYTIERSAVSSSGPWTVAGSGVTDNQTPWTDTGVSSGIVWYRVKGLNRSGVAGSYSPVFQATIT